MSSRCTVREPSAKTPSRRGRSPASERPPPPDDSGYSLSRDEPYAAPVVQKADLHLRSCRRTETGWRRGQPAGEVAQPGLGVLDILDGNNIPASESHES